MLHDLSPTIEGKLKREWTGTQHNAHGSAQSELESETWTPEAERRERQSEKEAPQAHTKPGDYGQTRSVEACATCGGAKAEQELTGGHARRRAPSQRSLRRGRSDAGQPQRGDGLGELTLTGGNLGGDDRGE
ncbi:unnamed protein product [Prorocentrum cordatum]|uniref:Uncharacterized protein n=1 Tax=Prorocentrum cordatum TaxID=2364126 RepID=A0ABN9UB56_9DINO|nr:unnamed protein product [Polarella glacialis]